MKAVVVLSVLAAVLPFNSEAAPAEPLVEYGTLDWAVSAGGPGQDGGFALTCSDGGVVLSGSHGSGAVFGAGQNNEVIVEDYGLYIAKYGPDGAFLWVETLRTSAPSRGATVAELPDRCLIVSGTFQNAIYFGGGGTNSTTLLATEGTDSYVAKYTADGILIWARLITGDGEEFAINLATGPDLIYVSGTFSESILFGVGEANEQGFQATGERTAFLAQYSADGDFLWAVTAGGAGRDRCECVSATLDGGAVITGLYEGPAVFGFGQSTETVLQGRQDAYVAKYSPDGELQWAKSAGGPSADYGQSVVPTRDNGVLVCGCFYDNAVFGAGEPGETLVTGVGSYDIFLAEFDEDGSLCWVRSDGGPRGDSPERLAATDTGGAVICGHFQDTIVFGAGEPSEAVLASRGGSDAFVAEYASDGALIWADSAGGAGTDMAYGVCSAADGSVFVAGLFEEAAVFGATQPAKTTLVSSRLRDIFLVKYVPSTVVFVNGANAGREDGLCWQTGFSAIQEGVNAAAQYEHAEVWVKGGTYRERWRPASPEPLAGALVLGDGTCLYGGFAGAETRRQDRDWELNTTIIDGSTGLYGRPARHTVWGAKGARLDGFTVTGGAAYHGLPGSLNHHSIGGGLICWGTDMSIARCTFTANHGEYGAALAIVSAHVRVEDCVFDSNFAGTGSGGLFCYDAHPYVSDCVFKENSGGYSGALDVWAAAPSLTRCAFDNNAGTYGGAAYAWNAQPTFKQCTFMGNTASIGAAMFLYESSGSSERCLFTGNHGCYGGAIANWYSDSTLVNCIFAQNSAHIGGALFNTGCTPTISNCTLADNHVTAAGGAIFNSDAASIVHNSIIWSNGDKQIYIDGPFGTVTAFSDVQGGWTGTGNLDSAPMFVGGAYELDPGSPCIDAAHMAFAPDEDFAGNPRPIGTAPDMGAYESH